MKRMVKRVINQEQQSRMGRSDPEYFDVLHELGIDTNCEFYIEKDSRGIMTVRGFEKTQDAPR